VTQTTAGTLKGKVAYMAPEQAACREDLDQRSDLFSLGIVAWELFALRRLFFSESHIEAPQRVLTASIPRLKSVVPGFSADISALVEKALQRDRELRHASVYEFADELRVAS
jgi:serine/threonine protein kinase